MSDGVQGVGSMPFNVASDIHHQSRVRESINNHLVEQRVEKEHRANHKHLESLREQRLDLAKGYDRFGAKTYSLKSESTTLNIEV